MTKEELRALVEEMRDLGVTKLQTGETSIELAPSLPSKKTEEKEPDFLATMQNTQHLKNLEMLFKHSSVKPFKKDRTK
jgi:hypothetical protein